jgi:hypothetical protein
MIECKTCNKKMERKSPTHEYCEDCQKERSVVIRREWKKKWYAQNKEKHYETWKKSVSPEGRRKRQKEYSLNHPEKIKAQIIAQIIPLKEKCEICGSKENLQRHHWRYDKLLMVNTLCAFCHTTQHRRLITA